MSRFRAALGILRSINAVDLLLPIGGALIASGMHNLAEREARQRHRLAALQTSVQTHLDALLSAGVDVAELAVDERHPLDAPGLAGAVNGITRNANPKNSSNSYPGSSDSSSSRRRGWKLAALALAGAAGVAYAFRGQLAEIVLPYLDAASADDELAEAPRFYPGGRPDADAPFGPITTVTVPGDEPTEVGVDRCFTCGRPAVWLIDLQQWRHVFPDGMSYGTAWTDHEVTMPPPVNEAAPAPWDRAEPVKPDLTPEPETGNLPAEGVELAPTHEKISGDDPEIMVIVPPFVSPDEMAAAETIAGDECGWPGCTWAPKPTTRGAARVTALAVHRARCVFRPPSMSVPGA